MPMIMDLQWSTVDVRDVAKSHIVAMENPNAKGRYLCSSDTIEMSQMIKVIHKHFPDFKLPSFNVF
jgi:dihydroflavonol-4-reductase